MPDNGKHTIFFRVHALYTISAIVIFTFGLGMAAIYSFNHDIQQKFSSIYSVFVPASRAMTLVRQHLTELQSGLQDIATLNAHTTERELLDHLDIINEHLTETTKLVGHNYAMRDITETLNRYYKHALQLANKMRQKGRADLTADIQDVFLLRTLLEDRIDAAEKYLIDTYQRDVLTAQSKIESVTISIFITILFLAITLVAISYVVTRSLAMRIRKLVGFAREVEKGNYDISLKTDWTDEFATVANALDAMIRGINEKNDALRRLANFDTLTGLHNRNALLQRLHAEIQSAQRHRYPLGFCLCDIDNFKKVNDLHGHLAGDQVLAGFADVLRQELRVEDVTGRYGGDELCVILPHTDAQAAQNALERVLLALGAREFTDANKQVFHVTASFGVATFTPGMTGTDLIRTADEALYIAKGKGRNCIVIKEK